MILILFRSTKVRRARALAAFDRDGKGVHSKAGLNLSDCVAYALAKSTNSTLLFKGNDFAQTDAEPALKPST
jgi:ribonuclease VapC